MKSNWTIERQERSVDTAEVPLVRQVTSLIYEGFMHAL